LFHQYSFFLIKILSSVQLLSKQRQSFRQSRWKMSGRNVPDPFQIIHYRLQEQTVVNGPMYISWLLSSFQLRLGAHSLMPCTLDAIDVTICNYNYTDIDFICLR